MLVKGDMTGDDRFGDRQGKAKLTLIVVWIAEKRTLLGAWCELVWDGDGGIQVAQITIGAQVFICWFSQVKYLCWCLIFSFSGWKDIGEVSRCVKGIIPVGWRKIRMYKGGSNHVIDSPYDMLGFTILRGCIRTSKPQFYAMVLTKIFEQLVFEFATIVAVGRFNSGRELGLNLFLKVKKCKKIFRLSFKGNVHMQWKKSSSKTR